MLTQVLLFQVLLPLTLLLWLALSHNRTRFKWLFKTIVVIGYLLTIHIGMTWVIVPWYLSYVLLVIAVILSARSLAHTEGRTWFTPWTLPSTLSLLGQLSVIMIIIAANSYLLSGRYSKAQEFADVSFPLSQGNYYAVNAGSNSVLNPNLRNLKPIPSLAAWQGISYGVDIVKINSFGFRARGTQPDEPQLYNIYGDQVFAPCNGTVVHTENNQPDHKVLTEEADKNEPLGNHVLLNCDGTEILLAHLQYDSVMVAPGNKVEEGAPLGRVGNSGKTIEPCLLISAQKRTPEQPVFGGQPLEIRFDGDYLVRNDRITP